MYGRFVYLAFRDYDPATSTHLLRADYENQEVERYAGNGKWDIDEQFTYADIIFPIHMTGYTKVGNNIAKKIMENYDRTRS